jgi:hypothetical protein
VGAIAGIAAVGSAQASPQLAEPQITHQVTSYADLLAPIQNAVELLKADDAARSQRSANARVAQYYNPYYGYPPPPPAANYYSPYYSANPYYYHHHHHHHHHRHDDRG